MEIERQAIERRDFPISRRGYDPASVDAHLRAVADRVEALAEHAHAEPTLAAAAGTQVQSIVASAESAAAEIRREAHAEAARTREQALADARTRLATVSAAADALLERVGAVDEALKAVLEHAQGAAAQLVRDLGALESDVRDQLDGPAAIGPHTASAPGAPDVDIGGAPQHRRDFPIPREVPGSNVSAATTSPEPSGSRSRVAGNPLAAAPDRPITAGPVPAVPSKPPETASGESGGASVSPLGPPATGDEDGGDGDLDSARLVALNMALGGESREDTGRYLAENFKLADPLGLVDEVYAAIDA